MFTNTDNKTLLTGANTIGLVSLLAYTLRTFNEVNSNIEELRSELDVMKKSYSENNKRSNIAFTHLNDKLAENTKILSTTISMSHNNKRTAAKRLRPEPEPEPEIVTEEESVPEIFTSDNQGDEIRGALSDLMNLS